MFNKKGMNKKAQEGGASAFTIVGWVLLAILLVLLVLVVAGFFNPLLEKLNLLPGGGVAGLVKACDGYMQIGSKADYCTFRELTVDGNTQWVNCMDKRVQDELMVKGDADFACAADAVKNQCVTLFKNGVKDPVVAGGVTKTSCLGLDMKCEVDSGFGGMLSLDKSCPPKGPDGSVFDDTKGLTKSVKGYTLGSEKDQVCCVAP